MKVNFLILICFVFSINLLKSQEQNRYNNPLIGWTITLPKDFKNISKQPVQLVETANKTEIKNNSDKNLNKKPEAVTFQGKNKTLFFSTFEKNNSDMKYSELVEKENKDFIDVLKKQRPQSTFEIIVNQETIDSINFYRTNITIDLGNNIFQNFIIFKAVINNFNSNFLIAYSNPTTESQELINAFKESKFEKNKK